MNNVEGNTRRRKLRIRWYGPLQGHIANPTLELKLRHNQVGEKRRYPLRPIEVGDQLNIEPLAALLDSDVPAEISELTRSLHPVLVNQYQRRYYAAVGTPFRITVDWDLRFFDAALPLRLGEVENFEPDWHVLELKYPIRHDDKADTITRHLPLRMCRMSKYVSGVYFLFG